MVCVRGCVLEGVCFRVYGVDHQSGFEGVREVGERL